MEVKDSSGDCLRNTGFKQTEMGLFPVDWDLTPLSVICRSICDGTHYTPLYVPRGVPFYSVENVTANEFTNTKFISEAEHVILVKRCKPERGDILMTRIGSLGDTKLLDWDVNASIYVSLALLKPSDRVCPEYLYRYSKSRAFVLEVEKRSLLNATPKKINMGDIGAIPIPVPRSLHEQKSIAETLTDTDALIESLDQLLAKKRYLKQGAMQQLLTGKKRLPGFSGEWETKRFGALGSTYGGMSGKTKNDFGHGNARYITFMNIMTNVVIDCGMFELVDVKPTETQNRATLGDLFFNGSSETPEEVGMCAVLMQEVCDVYLNSFCFGFRFCDGAAVDGLYLAYYFRSNQGRQLLKSLAQGATRYNLSKTSFINVSFPLPSMPEQTAIASVLSDMDAELAALEEKITKVRYIKQGMMQELLTGRIRLI